MKSSPSRIAARARVEKARRELVRQAVNERAFASPHLSKKGATPETRRKLTPDPIYALAQAGALDSADLQAVENIDAAFRAITAPVAIRPVCMEFVDGGGGSAEQWTGRMVQRVRDYNLWIDRMAREGWAVGPVLDVVVERQSMRAVGRWRRMHKNTVRRQLIRALDLYCVVVGWRARKR
ncbi:MAG: hypothetical protein ACE5EM_12455 [Sphingomonadales bacterium]